MTKMAWDKVERVSLAEAYSYCESIVRKNKENFTVGSWLLPKKLRPHLFALYAYCRHTDNLGDELEGDSRPLLHKWSEELERCWFDNPSHPILVALQHTIEQHQLSRQPFKDLIEANVIDQVKMRYETFDDLLRYCKLSANPVGRIVMEISGYDDPKALLYADAICTALQLSNFWQDVYRDFQIGRIYLPMEDMEMFKVKEFDLEFCNSSSQMKELMEYQVERTKSYFKEGLNLLSMVDCKLRFDLALFSFGGMEVLKLIEDQSFDVLSKRVVITRIGRLRILNKAVMHILMHKHRDIRIDER